MGKHKKKENILLIDGEGLLHQSYHKFHGFKSTDGKPSGAIFGFFKSLQMYIYRFKPIDIVVVFDNGHSKYRTEIIPTYKAHRKNISMDYESLHSQKKVIQKLLRIFCIKYIFDKDKKYNYEGDDYLAHLAIKWAPKNTRRIIITSDKDFNQLLVKQTTMIFNVRKDQLIYESNCKVINGYTAKECVDWLCLVGDKSDDIPGYPGIGEKKARKFLDDFTCIENYLESDQYLKGDKDHKIMTEVYERNRKMIDLRWFINHHPLKDLPMRVPKNIGIKQKALEKIANEYSLGSFYSLIFIKRFEEQIEKTYGNK